MSCLQREMQRHAAQLKSSQPNGATTPASDSKSDGLGYLKWQTGPAVRETAERRPPQAQPTPQRAIQHPQPQRQHSRFQPPRPSPPPRRANLQPQQLQAPAQEHSKLMAAPLVAQITRLEPRKMDNPWSGVEAPAGVMRTAQQYQHHPLQPQHLPPPSPQQRTPLPRTYLAQDQYYMTAPPQNRQQLNEQQAPPYQPHRYPAPPQRYLPQHQQQQTKPQPQPIQQAQQWHHHQPIPRAQYTQNMQQNGLGGQYVSSRDLC